MNRKLRCGAAACADCTQAALSGCRSKITEISRGVYRSAATALATACGAERPTYEAACQGASYDFVSAVKALCIGL